MTVHYVCQDCPATGEGDKAAEQHVRDTKHTVRTSTRKLGAA